MGNKVVDTETAQARKALRMKLGETPLPFVGYGPSGQPIGIDNGYRKIHVTEDLTVPGRYDPLRLVPYSIMQRYMYADQGFTTDRRFYLRGPALKQVIEYDRLLEDKVAMRARIVDPFRPAPLQNKGFCWGMKETVRTRGEMSWETFTSLLKKAVTTGATPEESTKLVSYVTEADEFFSFVATEAFDVTRFPAGTTEDLVIAAANLGIVDIPLNIYAPGSHVTGGIVDFEWMDTITGLLVNVGVPVDYKAEFMRFPYFEDILDPELQAYFECSRLGTPELRITHYVEEVEKSSMLKTFLSACGVDVKRFLGDRDYTLEVIISIIANRRIVIALGTAVGLMFYRDECWHADCDNSRGGVDVAISGTVSGAGTRSRYTGQDTCAWGNAMKLWEAMQ